MLSEVLSWREREHRTLLGFLLMGKYNFMFFCYFRSRPCFFIDMGIVINYKFFLLLTILILMLFWKCCIFSDIFLIISYLLTGNFF